MNARKFAIGFVGTIVVLVLIPAVWWFAGFPALRWVVAATLISMSAFILAVPIAAVKALLDVLDEIESMPLAIELDPRRPDLGIGVHREPEEKIQSAQFNWGEWFSPNNTVVPTYVCLNWDKENDEAYGSWWNGVPPHVLLRTRPKAREVYARLEKEAAKAARLGGVVRTAARRGAESHQRQTMEDYDAHTKPHGEAFTDAIDGVTEDLLDDLEEEFADGDELVDEDLPEDLGDDQEPGDQDATALPEGLSSAEETAVPDGGTDE